MNVASLELCKELYDLSRWGSMHDDSEVKDWHLDPDSVKGVVSWLCPAYDCGYLLRKLPTKMYIVCTGHQYCAAFSPNDEIIELGETAQYWCPADIPEDALCKLAIELFKQGVLTTTDPQNLIPKETNNNDKEE